MGTCAHSTAFKQKSKDNFQKLVLFSHRAEVYLGSNTGLVIILFVLLWE